MLIFLFTINLHINQYFNFLPYSMYSCRNCYIFFYFNNVSLEHKRCRCRCKCVEYIFISFCCSWSSNSPWPLAKIWTTTAAITPTNLWLKKHTMRAELYLKFTFWYHENFWEKYYRIVSVPPPFSLPHSHFVSPNTVLHVVGMIRKYREERGENNKILFSKSLAFLPPKGTWMVINRNLICTKRMWGNHRLKHYTEYPFFSIIHANRISIFRQSKQFKIPDKNCLPQ